MSKKSKASGFFGKFYKIVPVVIATASAIAAITPTPVDDGVLSVVNKVIDVIALNVGHASDEAIIQNAPLIYNDTTCEFIPQ